MSFIVNPCFIRCKGFLPAPLTFRLFLVILILTPLELMLCYTT